MNGWFAVLPALLLVIPHRAAAADDLNGAARELARKTAAFAGQGQPIAAIWNDVSSLGSPALNQARASFEAGVRESGARLSNIAPLVEARVTLSENTSGYLLIEEARKGEERQVWLASWKRGAPTALVPTASLEKRFVWEQEEPILDVAFPGDSMLILTPANLIWFQRQDGRWVRSMSLPIPAQAPPARDPRGRLRLSGPVYQAYLPGMVCKGAWGAPVSIDCNAGDPWVLESGSRAMLLANFSDGRNYFEGRITTQSGESKAVPPFYSAASAPERGEPLWLLASVDGRTRLFDAAFAPAGEIDSWGSDIAGTDARCGGGFQVLATRPGVAGEPEAVQAFTIENRSPVPLTPPLDFPGPITALWVSGGDSALAVSRNSETGAYEAYLLKVTCGQ